VAPVESWGPPDPLTVTEALESRNSASYSATDYEVQAALNTPTVISDGSMWARAIYDYYATTDEELTFMEGSLIRITRKQPHEGVDDGWWEGEFNGKVGAFPSLVVEELTSETQEVVSPLRPGPPDFLPPPPAAVLDPLNPHLAITQPTPSEEDGGGMPTTEDLKDYEERNDVDSEPFVPPPELEKLAADLIREVDCCQPAAVHVSNNNNTSVVEAEVHAPPADHVIASEQTVAPSVDDEEDFPEPPPPDFDQGIEDSATADSLC
jgi:hypothetical protein